MINLEVRIPDTPGCLIELIRPISNNGGNIFGILHHHDKKINNMIPVNISFELNADLREKKLENIKEELRKSKIQLDNIKVGVEQHHIIVILTGHVFDTDIVDTIKRLASKNIKVSELQAKFTEISEVSDVKLRIEFPEFFTKEGMINEINKICEEKDLILIRSL